VILALDGVPVNAEAMKKAIASKRPGDTVTVQYLREGLKKEVTVVLAKKVDPGYRIKRSPNPSPEQKKIYSGWISQAADETSSAAVFFQIMGRSLIRCAGLMSGQAPI
jgi:predicted metalloprotease with PDZ domain